MEGKYNISLIIDGVRYDSVKFDFAEDDYETTNCDLCAIDPFFCENYGLRGFCRTNLSDSEGFVDSTRITLKD